MDVWVTGISSNFGILLCYTGQILHHLHMRKLNNFYSHFSSKVPKVAKVTFNDKIPWFLILKSVFQFYLAHSKHARVDAKWMIKWTSHSWDKQTYLISCPHSFFLLIFCRPYLSNVSACSEFLSYHSPKMCSRFFSDLKLLLSNLYGNSCSIFWSYLYVLSYWISEWNKYMDCSKEYVIKNVLDLKIYHRFWVCSSKEIYVMQISFYPQI